MKQNQRILAALLLCAMLAGCTAQRPASAPETDGSAAEAAMPAAQLETDAAALAAEAEADEAEPLMLFCPAPPEIEGEQAVTVNRQRMQLYHGESGELMRLDEFAAAADGTLRQKRHADGNYTCHLELPCYSADFYNDDGVIFDGEHWYVPSQRLVMRPEVRAYTDEAENHVHYTTDQPADAVPEGYRVPILMYHAVSDDCWGIRELFVSPQSMEEQLQFLTENGYTTIWFEDLPNIAQYKKPIILTFDDGYDDNYTELFPLLKKYNAKATIFVIADRMDMEHKMTVEQAKEMSDSGLVSIQSHTMTHGQLDRMDEEQLVYQMEQSQLLITRMTGKVPRTLSYPEGRYTQLAVEVAKRYYDFATVMTGWCYTTGEDPYLTMRYAVVRDTDIWTFQCMARGQ